jgi:hypothetical protein
MRSAREKLENNSIVLGYMKRGMLTILLSALLVDATLFVHVLTTDKRFDSFYTLGLVVIGGLLYANRRLEKMFDFLFSARRYFEEDERNGK